MRVLESVIGWIAPPVCISCNQEGQALCIACILTEISPYGSKCWHCGKISRDSNVCAIARRMGSPNMVWVVTDYDATAKKVVQAYKFGQQRSLAFPIAESLIHTFLEFNSDKELSDKDYLMIPVPTATDRVRQRGFDHTRLLAQQINYKLNMQTAKNLHRIGQSRQVGAKRAERFNQLETSFYVNNLGRIKGRNILLVDDVITTGATICSATKALRAAGAKRVDALVFAKKL